MAVTNCSYAIEPYSKFGSRYTAICPAKEGEIIITQQGINTCTQTCLAKKDSLHIGNTRVRNERTM